MLLSDDWFLKYKELIYKESGIYFTKYNRSILESRLNTALKQHGLTDHDSFLKLLTSDKKEITGFIDSITTNLTKFFRNQAHFAAFEKIILPDLYKRNSSTKTLKLWSAVCSTGEEPYSLIISIIKTLPDYKNWNITIHASDISLRTLMTAKQGFYEKNKLSEIDKDILARCFINMNDGYEINPDIKKYIRFDYHNLMNACNFKEIDCIFCRNVIIYFDETAQEKVISSFYDTIKPFGYLFLGHSESLFFMKTKFKLFKTDNTTLYIKEP